MAGLEFEAQFESSLIWNVILDLPKNFSSLMVVTFGLKCREPDPSRVYVSRRIRNTQLIELVRMLIQIKAPFLENFKAPFKTESVFFLTFFAVKNFHIWRTHFYTEVFICLGLFNE